MTTGTTKPKESPAPSSRSVLRRAGERSFTLIETIIALSIIAFLIVEVATVQGNSIVFSEYGRNVTHATWLAKRVMSQVEYHWGNKEFKEMASKITERKFEDFPEYTYSLETKEWKFPFLQLLSGAMGGGGSGSSGNASGSAGGEGMLDSVIKQVFGDEPIFMTARADVCWSEGATKQCSGLTLLLTNKAKLDQTIVSLKKTYDDKMRPQGAAGTPPPTKPPTAGGATAGGGAPGGGAPGGATTGSGGVPGGGADAGGGGGTGGADGNGGVE